MASLVKTSRPTSARVVSFGSLNSGSPMQNAIKTEDAERAIKTTLRDLIDESVVDRLSVMPSDDATGEPSLFVTVYLRASRDRPAAAKSIDMIKAMRNALFDIGDERFPHLSFSAPDDELSEDTRRSE